MSDYFKRLQAESPTRFWINNPTVAEARLAIAAGAVGCTQNPTYVWKTLQKGGPDGERCQALIQEGIAKGLDNGQVVTYAETELQAHIAELFQELWWETDGRWGYASIQPNPLREDPEFIVEAALAIHRRAPNLMAKIPVTVEGLQAIARLVKEGVPINATECMSVSQVEAVCQAYVRASEGMAHPPAFCFSLITGIFDEEIQAQIRERQLEIPPEAAREAGFYLARKTVDLLRTRGYPCEFVVGGARALYHFTDIVGADAAITINWKGTADKLLALNSPIRRGIDREPALEHLALLREHLPVFEAACREHGLAEADFAQFPPVVRFRNGFVSAWKNAEAYVETQRKQQTK